MDGLAGLCKRGTGLTTGSHDFGSPDFLRGLPGLLYLSGLLQASTVLSSENSLVIRLHPPVSPLNLQ